MSIGNKEVMARNIQRYMDKMGIDRKSSVMTWALNIRRLLNGFRAMPIRELTKLK